MATDEVSSRAGSKAFGCNYMSNHKDYLGDAVYADFDGFGIVLTTEDGISATNTIYIEPEVFAALLRYEARLRQNREEPPPVSDGPGK